MFHRCRFVQGVHRSPRDFLSAVRSSNEEYILLQILFIQIFKWCDLSNVMDLRWHCAIEDAIEAGSTCKKHSTGVKKIKHPFIVPGSSYLYFSCGEIFFAVRYIWLGSCALVFVDFFKFSIEMITSSASSLTVSRRFARTRSLIFWTWGH